MIVNILFFLELSKKWLPILWNRSLFIWRNEQKKVKREEMNKNKNNNNKTHRYKVDKK